MHHQYCVADEREMTSSSSVLLIIPCVFVYENIPVQLFTAPLPTTDFCNDFI